ncbi:hypothetical protein ACPV5Q_10190 [Vibrio astriarenae]
MAANKSITELPWFKNATFIYALLAVIFASIILWDLWNNYILDVSIDGLNHSISSIFAPLVKLTAAYASFVGLLALNHRSIQSKEQIAKAERQIELANRQFELASKQFKLVQKQNVFTNYYKHIEEFTKYVENKGGVFKDLNPHKAHSIMFPDAKEGDYTPRQLDIKNIETSISFACGYLRQALEDNDYVSVIEAIKIITLNLEIPTSGALNYYGDTTTARSVNYILASMNNKVEDSAVALIQGIYKLLNNYMSLQAFEQTQQCNVYNKLLSANIQLTGRNSSLSIQKLSNLLGEIGDVSNDKISEL